MPLKPEYKEHKEQLWQVYVLMIVCEKDIGIKIMEQSNTITIKEVLCKTGFWWPVTTKAAPPFVFVPTGISLSITLFPIYL